MPITLANLADRAQNILADSGAAIWPQATIEEWVNAAIRDYSQRNPRAIVTTINASTADYQYDLPATFRDALRVEYPSGNTPPTYLTQRDHTDPNFYAYTDAYDIIRHNDVGTVDEIIISTSPTTGQSIKVYHTADHDSALASGGTVTVPLDHHNTLILYVIWQAFTNRHMEEAAAPTTASSLLTEQLANSAQKARDDYLAALAATTRAPSARRAWRMDPHDPIY